MDAAFAPTHLTLLAVTQTESATREIAQVGVSLFYFTAALFPQNSHNLPIGRGRWLHSEKNPLANECLAMAIWHSVGRALFRFNFHRTQNSRLAPLRFRTRQCAAHSCPSGCMPARLSLFMKQSARRFRLVDSLKVRIATARFALPLKKFESLLVMNSRRSGLLESY